MTTSETISISDGGRVVLELFERAVRRQQRLNTPETVANHDFHYGTLEGYLQALSLLTGFTVADVREAVKNRANS